MHTIIPYSLIVLFMLPHAAIANDVAPGKPDKEVSWSYDNDYTGQEEWGLLATAFAACGIGTQQSPIHISYTEEVRADIPMFSYSDTEIDVRNIGYTFELNPSKKMAYEESGKKYFLKSIQFHTPSEHVVKDTFFPMEIQFFHEDDEGKKLIVAVFAKIGTSSDGLDTVLDVIPTKQGITKKVRYNPALLLPYSFAHYAYPGSLTTPPCTEGIEWRIMKKTITLSKEQMMKLAQFTRRNARLVQPVYMRTVKEVN